MLSIKNYLLFWNFLFSMHSLSSFQKLLIKVLIKLLMNKKNIKFGEKIPSVTSIKYPRISNLKSVYFLLAALGLQGFKCFIKTIKEE